MSDGGRVSGGIAPNGGTTFTTAATGPPVTYLRSQRKREDWILAVASAGSAEPIIINSGEPVMALGGFFGSDPIVTEGQLARLVADGRVRFFLASENGGGFGGGAVRSGAGATPFGSRRTAHASTRRCGRAEMSTPTTHPATQVAGLSRVGRRQVPTLSTTVNRRSFEVFGLRASRFQSRF